MLTIAFLTVVVLEAAVVVKARASLDQTRTQSQVIGFHAGDLPIGSIIPVPGPELTEAAHVSLAPQVPSSIVTTSPLPQMSGGTAVASFESRVPAAREPLETAAPAKEATARLAALELPLPPAPGLWREQNVRETEPHTALPRPPPAGTADRVLAMLAPPPLGDVRPPAELRDPPSPPLLEPHMEMFEDWVTRAPMNRHPGFHKVHFAPNVQGRCLPKTLLNVLYDVGMKFGDVKVISGYRSPSHNRAVGGATRSLHMECRAIDFFVAGSGSGVVDWLLRRKEVGGYKRYPFGSFHIDNGPRRTWAWGKRKKRRR